MGRHSRRLGALLVSAANMPGKYTTNSIMAPIVPISANGPRPSCGRPPRQTGPGPPQLVLGNRGGTTVFHPTYEGPPGRDEHSQSVQKRAHGWPRGWRMGVTLILTIDSLSVFA